VSKNILIIGPYAPRKCGIATHIVQFKKKLEEEGHNVKVLSYSDCNGDITKNLKGLLRPLKLLSFKSKFNDVYIHFTPEQFFYVGKNFLRFFNFLPLISFLILFLFFKKLKLIFHEPPLSKFLYQRWLSFIVWSNVSHAVFFTETEKYSFEKKFFFRLQILQSSIQPVNKYFIKYNFPEVSKLKKHKCIDLNKKIFLMTGFLHPNKGYDIPIEIFKNNNLDNSLLLCLTSIRDRNDLAVLNFNNKIQDLSNQLDNFIYIDYFMEEKEQDSWIFISDFIIFPYRQISNSGILGRAKIYNKTCIVSEAGGLKDQIDKDDIFFKSSAQLENVIIDLDANSVI